MNIDLTKYKRLFTFGCSFTNYRFPTWAHILSKSMHEGCEFHNLGRGSGGNLFIANRITEANKKFKFNEDDLVVVMWSTLCREDRFVNDNWLLAGNIFTQGYYPDSFVKEFSDPVGYLIRDLSLIELSKTYLDALPCDNYLMLSVPFNHQVYVETEKTTEIMSTYTDLIESFPPSLFDLEMNNKWTDDVSYIGNENVIQIDYHPTPINYYNYLTKLGFELNEVAKQYAIDSENTYRSATSIQQLQAVFYGEYDFFTTENMW
jgi:hypothetical protein